MLPDLFFTIENGPRFSEGLGAHLGALRGHVGAPRGPVGALRGHVAALRGHVTVPVQYLDDVCTMSVVSVQCLCSVCTMSAQ